jgi:hypothetical protein
MLAPILAAAVELSTIVVPIHASLAPLLPALESQVPKTQVKLDAYELDPQKQFGMKYRVQRDPIVLNMLGTGLHATTTVHYAMEGCRRTVKPIIGTEVMWPCVSCGFGEPMRDAYIAIDSTLSWDANWRLQSRTRARPAEFPNGCRVTFAGINIADWKIAPIVNAQLQQAARTIDANTPKLTNIRPQAQQVWTSLQAPQEIAPRTWLVMEPVEVAMAPLAGAGLNVSSAIVLRAQTRVVVGERPAIAAKPLPPLRTVRDAASGIRIPFNVQLSYDEASRLLTENFGRRKYQDLSVDTIRLMPGHENKLAMEVGVDYRASTLRKYRGLVRLEGTPVFDATTRTIALKDLDYTLDPKRRSLFLRIANKLAHDTLRKNLEEGARWSIAPQIATIRAEIARAIVRPLAPGVFLRGRVDDITPLAIGLHADAIAIDVVATGNAEVEIR